MTFEEWFAEQENCQPTDWNSMKSAYRFWVEIARRAWDEGYEQGVADSDPAVHVEEGLPGMGDYTYKEFSRDSDRW